MRILPLMFVLMLTGCAAKPPAVTLPLGQFAYTLGELSQTIKAACAAKKLTPAECERFTEIGAKAKAAMDAPPAAGTDWGEVLGAFVKMGAKAAL